VYELIVIGTSWGGLDAVSRLLDGLHDDVRQPIVLAQHRSAQSEDGGLEQLLARHTRRAVSDVRDKTPLEQDHVYVGPADYHVLVEGGHLALSTDAPVRFSRPSIDVLFESAADTFGARAVLTNVVASEDEMLFESLVKWTVANATVRLRLICLDPAGE